MTPITPILAQLDDFIAPKPQPLPGPGAVDLLLFESVWILPLMLVAAGVIAVIALRRREKPKHAAGAFALCAVVAAGAWGTSTAVRTDREIVADATRTLIEQTATADDAALRDLLTADAVVSVAQAPGGLNAIPAAVLTGPGWIASQYQRIGGVRAHGIRDLQATIDGPSSARSQVSVWVEAGDIGRRGSWWLIDWRRDAAGDWKARQVEAVWIQGLGSR